MIINLSNIQSGSEFRYEIPGFHGYVNEMSLILFKDTTYNESYDIHVSYEIVLTYRYKINLGLYSALIAFKQGCIFIVSHLL